jgi:hypothetical protein
MSSTVDLHGGRIIHSDLGIGQLPGVSALDLFSMGFQVDVPK